MYLKCVWDSAICILVFLCILKTAQYVFEMCTRLRCIFFIFFMYFEDSAVRVWNVHKTALYVFCTHKFAGVCISKEIQIDLCCYVSFAKEPCFCTALLQKSPANIRILFILAFAVTSLLRKSPMVYTKCIRLRCMCFAHNDSASLWGCRLLRMEMCT